MNDEEKSFCEKQVAGKNIYFCFASCTVMSHNGVFTSAHCCKKPYEGDFNKIFAENEHVNLVMMKKVGNNGNYKLILLLKCGNSVVFNFDYNYVVCINKVNIHKSKMMKPLNDDEINLSFSCYNVKKDGVVLHPDGLDIAYLLLERPIDEYLVKRLLTIPSLNVHKKLIHISSPLQISDESIHRLIFFPRLFFSFWIGAARANGDYTDKCLIVDLNVFMLKLNSCLRFFLQNDDLAVNSENRNKVIKGAFNNFFEGENEKRISFKNGMREILESYYNMIPYIAIADRVDDDYIPIKVEITFLSVICDFGNALKKFSGKGLFVTKNEFKKEILTTNVINSVSTFTKRLKEDIDLTKAIYLKAYKSDAVDFYSCSTFNGSSGGLVATLSDNMFLTVGIHCSTSISPLFNSFIPFSKETIWKFYKEFAAVCNLKEYLISKKYDKKFVIALEKYCEGFDVVMKEKDDDKNLKKRKRLDSNEESYRIEEHVKKKRKYK